MNKQTSIALHLAQAVRQHGYVSTDIRWPGRVESMGDVWNPHADLSQWAECELWAAMNGCWPDVMATRVSYDAIESGWIEYVPHDGTTEGIQAATLEAIARATGWEESK